MIGTDSRWRSASRVEFLDNNGALLEGAKRRLATHAWLGTPDLAEAPFKVVEQVYLKADSCSVQCRHWGEGNALSCKCPLGGSSGRSRRNRRASIFWVRFGCLGCELPSPGEAYLEFRNCSRMCIGKRKKPFENQIFLDVSFEFAIHHSQPPMKGSG